MIRSVTKSEYIEHHIKVLTELQKQIFNGFKTLDSIKMKELENLLLFRKKLIAYAKSGKQREFFIS